MSCGYLSVSDRGHWGLDLKIGAEANMPWRAWPCHRLPTSTYRGDWSARNPPATLSSLRLHQYGWSIWPLLSPQRASSNHCWPFGNSFLWSEKLRKKIRELVGFSPFFVCKCNWLWTVCLNERIDGSVGIL